MIRYKGKIYNYDKTLGAGTIVTEDNRFYYFNKHEIKNKNRQNSYIENCEVEFSVDGYKIASNIIFIEDKLNLYLNFKLLFVIFAMMFLAFMEAKSEVINNTFKFEGTKYVSNKIETSKYGISSYYVNKNKVKNLTQKEAYNIAYNKIYKAHKIDKLNDIRQQKFIFDWIFHSAPAGAIKRIQAQINIYKYNRKPVLNMTGIMNEDTINELNSLAGNEEFLSKLVQSRLYYLRSLKHYPIYKNNWEHRVKACLK